MEPMDFSKLSSNDRTALIAAVVVVVTALISVANNWGVFMILSLLAGLAVIFAGGVSWLSLLPGQTLSSAIATGFLPFVLVDLAKAVVAAKILPVAWKFAGRPGR